MNRVALTTTLLAAGLLTGCASDRPAEYGEARQPVDQINTRDRGLQSADVVQASDKLAMDLMALPEINQSPVQLTIVFTTVENLTTEPNINYDIFLERLRVNVARLGRGRVAVIDNRDRVANIQARELDSVPPSGDRFGQGGTPAAGGGATPIQPEYALYGKLSELPNRKTSYYLATFQLTNLRTRQMVWTDQYEVKTLR
jgi:hypothetical protein